MQRLLFISAAAVLLPLVSWAGESCPWLNSATAAGVLGGSVTTSVTHSDKGEGGAVCEFTSQSDVPSVLRIEVAAITNPAIDFTSWLAKCGGSGTPIRGIGNQAVACPVENGSNMSEQVISRVRKRALLVQVTVKKNVKPPPLREEARTAAELVAGNLF